jgi:hypothetical protein
MKLADVPHDTKNSYALDLFTPATVADVEKLLIGTEDKPYLRCQVRGKDVQAKPEEIVRQLWIHRLLQIPSFPPYGRIPYVDPGAPCEAARAGAAPGDLSRNGLRPQ